jgi:hypothetical protein
LTLLSLYVLLESCSILYINRVRIANLLFASLASALRFQNNTLKLFKDDEVLVGIVGFSVALLFRNKKADFFEFFKFTLDVSGVFFNEFSEAANVRLEVRVLGVHDNNFSPHS